MIRPDICIDTLEHEASLDMLTRHIDGNARAALRKIPMLGAVAWLLLQQPGARCDLLGDLEWRVLPPLMLEQSQLFMNGDAPLAYASWAYLSAEAGARFAQRPHRLTSGDWRSGADPWLVDLIAPFGGAADILSELRARIATGRPLRQLVAAPDLPARVLNWPPVATADGGHALDARATAETST